MPPGASGSPGAPVACPAVRRSERIHLAVPPEVARTVVQRALDLDDDLRGLVPGSEQSQLVATVAAADGGSDVGLVAENTTVVPFFHPLFRLVFRFELRRGLRWATTAIDAALAGHAPPDALGHHPLSTPGRFDQSQTNLIAVVSFAGVVTAF